MSLAVIKREVDCGLAGTVVVRELTLSEIRAHLAFVEARESAESRAVVARDELIDVTLLGGLTTADLLRFTDLDESRVGHLTPSAARVLLAAVKELNPDFFAMLDQWQALLIERVQAGLILSEQQ